MKSLGSMLKSATRSPCRLDTAENGVGGQLRDLHTVLSEHPADRLDPKTIGAESGR
jgi:hypothetical protein